MPRALLVEDRVARLDAGADDYLVKPFSVAEFGARVRALLRRPDQFRPIVVGNCLVDPVGRTAEVDGKALALTPREWDVLLVLARHAGTIVPRTAMLEAAWGVQAQERGHALEVHVSALRRHLRLAGAEAHIDTVRCVGYRLALVPFGTGRVLEVTHQPAAVAARWAAEPTLQLLCFDRHLDHLPAAVRDTAVVEQTWLMSHRRTYGLYRHRRAGE